MASQSYSNIRLLSGRSNRPLANAIASILNISLVSVKFVDFGNTEMNVQILDNIRGNDMFILQTGSISGSLSVNDIIIELELLINACKLASVKSITLIIPHLPYSRSDKKDLPRTPIASSFLLRKLEFLGATRIVSMDLHSGQIQGFVGLPYDNLYAKNILCDYLVDKILVGDLSNFILVSPDNGGAKRIESYAKKLKLQHIIMHKQRDHSEVSKVIKSIIVGAGLSELVGKTAIIVDDIGDTMGTMMMAVQELKTYGITRVVIVVTHGVLSGQISIDRINNEPLITDVIVTNTIDQTDKLLLCSKLKVVDTSIIFAQFISRLTNGGSISELF